MLIGITLTIMMVITLFSIIAGNSFIGIVSDYLIENSAIINGTTTTLEIPPEEIIFGLDPLTGGIALILSLAVIGGLITVQVLGTGLSDNGSRIIMISIFYVGIWTILSIIASPLIIAIEVFGFLIYLTLTILYAIGVIKLNFGGYY